MNNNHGYDYYEDSEVKIILMLERFIVSERLGKMIAKDAAVSEFVGISNADKGIELTLS